MTRAVARTPLDVLFYPTVYSYFPAMTRAQVVLGVHDVIAEDYPELVFPDRRGRMLWNLKGRLAHWQADRIVTVSEYARAGIIRRFGRRPEEVWVVGEAPDAAFQPVRDAGVLAQALARHGLAASARYIACLGGLNPHKNLGTLLSVVADLRREAQFSDLQVVLIGPTESDTFTPGAGAARQAAAQLHLDGAVRFTGYLPDEEVACLLSAAQVLALPSLDEGFGLAAVEAAACGTAVVATRNSPLPRLLEGGGLFVDPTRPQELRAALAALLGDDAARRQMSRTALERARTLTWQKAATQFLDLMASLSAQASPTGGRR
jgi:glycosyltransferase involved in cell wall biosynthesis